jgi:hypothetical protein
VQINKVVQTNTNHFFIIIHYKKESALSIKFGK